MYRSFILAAALTGLSILVPAYAQDQKPAMPAPQAGQAMTMPPEMVARMNNMMDKCEKMMGDHDMKKGMRHHKRS
jgi:hypothetical protein